MAHQGVHCTVPGWCPDSLDYGTAVSTQMSPWPFWWTVHVYTDTFRNVIYFLSINLYHAGMPYTEEHTCMMQCTHGIWERDYTLSKDCTLEVSLVTIIIIAGNFWGRKIHKFQSFSATCESFLYEILGMPHPHMIGLAFCESFPREMLTSYQSTKASRYMYDIVVTLGDQFMPPYFQLISISVCNITSNLNTCYWTNGIDYNAQNWTVQ